jgi:hypothetical protein
LPLRIPRIRKCMSDMAALALAPFGGKKNKLRHL